jgi:AcrR family transcriptional regulator
MEDVPKLSSSSGRPSDPSAPRQPIGRGERAKQRVLAAALEVLAEQGLAGFNMESVARRAGAGKATLYRHWASPSALLIDAMDAQFRPFSGVSTGDLRADLTTLLSNAVSLFNDTPFPRLMAAFIDAAERDPSLARLHAEITDRRREPVLEVLGEAVQRGEVAPDADLELIVDLLTAPFFYRRFIAHRPIPPTMPAQVVDQVLAALRFDGIPLASGPSKTKPRP